MFNKVGRTSVLESWVMRRQPIAYSNAEDLYTDLILLRDQLFEYGDLSDNMVDYLNEFVKKFDTNLYNTTYDILLKWFNDGKFDELFKSTIFKDFTTQLENKRDKSVKITSADLDISSNQAKIGMINLQDEVIQAILGQAEVSPIILDRSITGTKLVEKTITQNEIGFLINNSNLNLFSGVYRMGSVRGAVGDFYIEGTSNPNYKLAVVTVEPNTVYYIKRSLPSRLNIATSTKSVSEGEKFDGAVNLNYSLTGVSYYPQYVKVTTGANDKYMYLSMSLENTEPYLCVSKTPPKNNVNYYYNQPNRTVDIHSETNLTEPYNLFGGEYERDGSIQGSEPYTYIARTGGRTAIIPIVPNTNYTLIRETPSRLNWGTATDIVERGNGLDGSIKRNDSGAGTTSTPDLINFRTGENDKFLYINVSVDNTEPVLRVIEGTVTSKDGQLNYYDKKLANSFKRWLNDNLALIPSIGVSARKTRIKYTANTLFEIWQPTTKNKYIKYEYTYVDSASINMKQWRLLKVYVTDETFAVLHDLDLQCEWEGAIKESGADDFMGGTHGDEINNSIKVYVDGTEKSMVSNFDINCESVRIINKSTLNRVGKPTENLLARTKVNVWEGTRYSVENIYNCLSAFTIEQCKIGLMSCRYNDNGNLINSGYRHTDYNVQSMSASGIGDLGDKKKDVNAFTISGDNIDMTLTCEAEFSKYPNANQYIENFSSDTSPRCKVYFDVTGLYNLKLNEQIKSKSYFDILG